MVSVKEGLGESYMWVTSVVHDGPVVEEGSSILSYT